MQATQTKRFGWSAASGEAAKLVRAHDWASTPLGPIDEWPQSLRLPVSLILDSPLAMIVLWGPELIQVYNDGYRVILNHLHPRAMGQPTQECWPEVWEFNRPLYEAVFRGQCRSFVDQKLTIWRTGVAEDAWFDLTYSPLRNEDDSVGGVLITVVEVTERHMSEAASRASEAHLRIVLEGIGEEATRESVMRQAFLLQFSDALRPIADPYEIQRKAMRLLGKHLDVNRAMYFEIGVDRDRLTAGPAYLNGVAEMPSPTRLSDFSETLASEYRKGTTFVVNDVLSSPELATAADAFAAIEVRATTGVPLVKNGHLVAIMGLHQNTPRVWKPSEVALLEEVAERTWAAVERARAEAASRESEERFRLFVDNVLEYAFVQTDFEGIVTSWNPGAERLSGYSSAEIVGKPFALLLPEEDRHGGVIAREMAAISRGERKLDAHTMQRKDGSRFWAEWMTEPVLDDKGQLRGAAKVIRDETERQKSNLFVRNSLAEKEELLREVHHRVKNNLQVITSMLNLQAATMDDQRALAVFEEMRNRVQSIASIHELLYRSASFASIPLTAYAKMLLPGLVQFYGLENRVDGQVIGDNATIELERAVPFALILNELISNGLKHGFPDGATGELRVRIETRGPDTVLCVSDTGIGLPHDFDAALTTCLGLRLVDILVRQLRGTFRIVRDAGPLFEVRFPAIDDRKD